MTSNLAPPPVPFSLVAEGSNEDGKGVDLGVRGQDPGKALGANPVALQVGVAEHHHKVLVGLLPRQRPDAGVGGLQRVVAAHAELRVGVHGLEEGEEPEEAAESELQPGFNEAERLDGS